MPARTPLASGPAPPPPDLRLVPSVIAGWAACWWVTARGPLAAGALLGACGTLAVLAALALAISPQHGAFRRRRTVVLALIVASALTGLLLAGAGVRLLHRQHDPLLAWAAAGKVVTVTGRVSADPVPLASRFSASPQRWLVHLSAHRAQTRGQIRDGSAPVVVMGGAAWSGLAAGQLVRARGRLAPARPGEAAVTTLGARTGPIVLGDGSWPWRVAGRLRSGLRHACSGLPQDARGLLPALVDGDTSQLPGPLRDDLRTSGLTHLTAVSGANLVIVATAVSTLLALAGAKIRLRVLGSALAVAGFVVLARPEPSVLRAAVMAGLGLIALLSARPGRGVPLLSGTALLLLLADPWLSRSFGFALSVLATAGLLLLVPAWLRRAAGTGRDRPPRRWLPVLCAPIAVPVAALVCTAPVTVLLQPQLSAVGVPANLFAEPAVPFATLLGVLAAVLSPWWPWAAALAARAGGLATSWIAGVAHRGAAVPGAGVPWLPGAAGALILTGVLLAVVVLSLRPPAESPRRRSRPEPLPRMIFQAVTGAVRRRHLGPEPGPKPGSKSGPGSRRGSGLAVVLAVLLMILGVAGGRALLRGQVLAGAGAPADWLVIQCDVGQGAATLLRTGPERAVLADTGPDPSLLSRCLRRNHIRALDLVVITHFHADHAGGITAVLPRYGHPPVLVSPLARPPDQAASVRSVAAAAGSPLVIGQAGMAGVLGAGPDALSWRLVFPGPDLAGRLVASGPGSPGASDDGTQINDSSLAMLVTLHGVHVMLLGDLETDAQQSLLATVPGLGPVDVLVVAHHGSARQYPPLYSALAPRVALIGVGADNDYGHPAPSALSLLRRIGARTLRTDTQGQLTIAGTPERLRTSVSR